MCQFSACQSWDDREQRLFQPLSIDAAAHVRAGWWAYHYAYQSDHSFDGSSYGSPYGSHYGVPSQSLSHLETLAHGSSQSYGYGYGTEF